MSHRSAAPVVRKGELRTSVSLASCESNAGETSPLVKLGHTKWYPAARRVQTTPDKPQPQQTEATDSWIYRPSPHKKPTRQTEKKNFYAKNGALPGIAPPKYQIQLIIQTDRPVANLLFEKSPVFPF